MLCPVAPGDIQMLISLVFPGSEREKRLVIWWALAVWAVALPLLFLSTKQHVGSIRRWLFTVVHRGEFRRAGRSYLIFAFLVVFGNFFALEGEEKVHHDVAALFVC